MNQGPRGDCLMKKTEGRKSRDTVPLNNHFLAKLKFVKRRADILFVPYIQYVEAVF
jgi:hypothetical protein